MCRRQSYQSLLVGTDKILDRFVNGTACLAYGEYGFHIHHNYIHICFLNEKHYLYHEVDYVI